MYNNNYKVVQIVARRVCADVISEVWQLWKSTALFAAICVSIEVIVSQYLLLIFKLN